MHFQNETPVEVFARQQVVTISSWIEIRTPVSINFLDKNILTRTLSPIRSLGLVTVRRFSSFSFDNIVIEYESRFDCVKKCKFTVWKATRFAFFLLFTTGRSELPWFYELNIQLRLHSHLVYDVWNTCWNANFRNRANFFYSRS